MVKIMVRIQPAKDPGLFDSAVLGNMHTPVEGLIEHVVGRLSDQPAPEDRPPEKISQAEKEGQREQHQPRRIPPRKGDLFFVFLSPQMVGAVSTKEAVMDQGVRMERIVPQQRVHNVLM